MVYKTSQHSIYAVGYLAALLPLVTMHLAFLASAMQGYIDWCVPYWLDCVSVSKSGRYGLAYFVFKGGMLPAAIVIGYFWQLCSRWLSTLGATNHATLAKLGWTASAALILYTLALGHAGESFQLLRRFGVVLFMGLTFILQVMVGRALQQSEHLCLAGRNLLRVSASILAIAIVSLFLDAWMGADYRMVENAFEWWLIVLLIFHLVLVSRISRSAALPSRY